MDPLNRTMETTFIAWPQRRAIAIDIDLPFQRVLTEWLGARSYRVSFMALAAASFAGEPVDLVLCELAAPREANMQALHMIARLYRAPLIAISSRFVAGAGRAALGRQLGVDAGLAKPFSRDDLYGALDALAAARDGGN